ncbi:MAG: tryptophan-rich sensory protein [Firmicutes bacterium]|nr:tryptophan-rich sensory protein [Bacillota bacterium]
MGFFGGLASIKAVDFYQALSRPSWAPPASVFGPVWTLLYLFMAVAAWLVWRDYGFRRSGAALWLFLVQMVLNALWTWLFFHWKNGALAFAEILALWLLILATLTAFWRLRTPAGALLLPYLAWVTFATFLTYSIWKQNPTLLG